MNEMAIGFNNRPLPPPALVCFRPVNLRSRHLGACRRAFQFANGKVCKMKDMAGGFSFPHIFFWSA